jgi:amidase
MFEEALERAKQADAHLAEKGKPLGPLHGLPISLKDSYNVIGTHTTIGYVSYLKHPPASHNSALVEILLKLGAIPFVKTNIPQSMMTADSENNVFGRTLNPNKLCLTAGGSTGGEGALLKMRGSILGAGTDIAGSIRIPAHCNGIFGLKPSASRLPFGGKTPPGRLGSPSSILAVAGPEAHSVADIALFMKSVMDAEPWIVDEGCLDVPWRTVPAKKLKLGMILEEPKFPLHPPVLRMMETVRSKLTAAGIGIVDLQGKNPSLYESLILVWKYFMLDPKRTPLQIIKAGEESMIKSIATTTCPELQGWQASLDALFDMNMQRAQLLKTYHDLFIDNNLDGIIMPTYQATAPPHDTYGMVPYTSLANLLNVSLAFSLVAHESCSSLQQYPSASLPYLKASKEEDKPFIRSGTKYEPPCKFCYSSVGKKCTLMSFRQSGLGRRCTLWISSARQAHERRRVGGGNTSIRGNFKVP